MEEKFLYHIWKYRLFNSLHLKTTSGETLELIKTGEFQHDSGPDFFNAQVKIGNTVWAGNIELDIRSSDWKKHGHSTNEAYRKIILHVVYEVDQPCKHNNPVLELKNYINKSVFEAYEKLNGERNKLPCYNEITTVEEIIRDSWLDRLLMERLERKTTEINLTLQQNKNNWEEAFYHSIAKNFGFKTNAVPFELLARSIPLHVLAKHKNNLLQIEALLFGQAGMLEEKLNDDYYIQLFNEYRYLKIKFNLTPVETSLWKFLRLRPANFPTIRIAQFASLIHKSSHLFSRVIESKNIRDFDDLFKTEISGYWNEHYLFGNKSNKKNRDIGKGGINLIVINTVIPFLFYYGKCNSNNRIMNRSIQFLENLAAEKNHITTYFSQAGLTMKSAAQTQSLLELYSGFCSKKRCLECAIGLKILNRNIKSM